MQVSQMLQSLNVVVIHIRMKHYHSYMSRDVITWSLDWRVGMPTKIGGYHSIISQYLIILIKVIKATAPKFKLIKVTHSYRKRDLWKCYPYKWRVSNQNFFFYFFYQGFLSRTPFFHGGDHLLFHSATSIRSQTFRYKFATLHLR